MKVSGCRPPFALERLEANDDEHLRYHFSKPQVDGTTELRITPLELINRIAALVLPPRVHRHRYHGVLAPNSPLRPHVTALARDTATDEAAPEPDSGESSALDCSLLNHSSPTRLGGDAGRGRSGRRPARPTSTGGRIRPARAVVAAFAVAELNRRRSPVLRVALPDDPDTPSRQQGSPVTPPSSTPTSLPRACSQPSSSLLPLVASPPYPLWCG